MKNRQKLVFPIFFFLFVLLYQCKKSESDNPIIPLNAIDLHIELKNKLVYIDWKFNDTINIDSYSLKRYYSKKKENSLCDTSTILSKNEFDNCYSLYMIENCFRSDNLEQNTFIDSSFSYSNGLFYTIETYTSFKTSKYVKLILPELPIVESEPYKVIVDNDLNLLILLDISNKVKIITFDLNKEKIINTYLYEIDGTNFAPLPDICTGILNGNKKLFLALRTEVFVFALPNLTLERTIQLEDYLGAIAFKDNYIYTCNYVAQFYKISYSDMSISKINSDLFPMALDYEMRILDDYLFFFTVKNSEPTAIKYQIQNNGDLIKKVRRELGHFMLNDIDYSPNSLFVLSNGYILDDDLNLSKDLKLLNSNNIFAITDNTSKITFNKPSTKELITYDLITGSFIENKRLLSYPIFIKSCNLKNFCIGKFGNNVCIEPF